MDNKLALAGKRIIVAGAGIAGLAFVRALDRNWPEGHPKPQVVLYERSSEKLDRSREGYTMGIKGDGGKGGLGALKAIGLLDRAVSLSTTGINSDSQMPNFWTKDWKALLKTPAPPPPDGLPVASIRLQRFVLRQILLEGLPTDTKIHWKTGCDSADILSDGTVDVRLSDGTTDHCDFLVCADGANSNIRTQLLPDDTLQFAGPICFLATSRFPAGKPALLKEDWGISISGKGVPFLTFPVDEHAGVWALSYMADKERPRIKGEEALRRKDEILDEVRRRGHMFGEPFGEFLDATDPATLQVFSAKHKSPIAHSKVLSHASMIFIGDANHAMSPFSGSGANMALMDGVELGKRLCGATDVREAIDEFDAESAPRCQSAVDGSWWMIRILHSSGPTWWLLNIVLVVVRFLVARKKGPNVGQVVYGRER